MGLVEVVSCVIAVPLGLLLLLLAGYTAVVFLAHRRYAQIPCPKGRWFYFGHLPAFVSQQKQGKLFYDLICQWRQEVGPLFVIWSFHNPTLMVTDANDIQELSTTRIPRPDFRLFQKSFGERFAGRNVQTIQTYEEWKGRRRTLDPAFARNYLRSLVPKFISVVQEDLIDVLKAKADGRTVVDMKDAFANTTLQVLSRVAFSTNFATDPYIRSLTGDKGILFLLDHLFEGFKKTLTNPLYKWFGNIFGKEYIESARKVRAIGRRCIEQRIEALNRDEDIPKDILTQILCITKIEQNLGVEDLVDDFVAFYTAGQETTANMLSFAIIEILQHEDVLTRIQAEVDEVFGDKQDVDADDLDKMIYTKQVLDETLRLWPPAIIVKEAPADLTLSGCKIPEGTYIFISSYAVQRDPQHFDNPCKFEPSRFDPEQKKPSPYVYCPFGIGHRSCIGRTFAIMEAKVVLGLLLSRFTLTLPKDYKLKPVEIGTLQPDATIPCTLTLRQ